MERTQELFERIELYLAKQMSVEETIAFEKEMTMNSELELEVEKHRELQRVLSDTDTLRFKEKLQKISEEIKQENSKSASISYSLFWKIAASIVILIGVGTLLWNTLNTSDDLMDLYTAYYEVYPVEDVTRGSAATELDLVMKNYEQGNYEKVVAILSQDTSFSLTEQMRLYLGNSYLNLGREQDALKQFEQIRLDSKYSENANWYSALTYLKLKEVKKASVLLRKIIDFDGIYREKAQELLTKLED
ncbi:tetratricopeptide repeat protein [Aquimarina litoralis]|uniref:tetratricopeptide repeat protein n=1 Tax=Aquimarina litoralis TaxID=584605 RepID=UPI001C58871F|nr:hypothetical protein [Aquimarina litoralis]MBW1295304.1 hypothetical protein [Aquimarina litoralis]